LPAASWGSAPIARGRIGDDGVRTFAELNDFATDVDIAVIGLGN
jgi:hypothetical protein